MTHSDRARWAHSPVTRRAALGGAASGGLALLLAACSGGAVTRVAGHAPSPLPSSPDTPSSTPVTPKASSTHSAPPARTVHVQSQLGDGVTVGVGMPIVLTFDPSPTDAAAFVKAAKVSIDGKPVEGAWYWSHPYAGEPMQAHFRTQDYWPPNATVHVDLPVAGLSAGEGLVYGEGLSSVTFHTGDKVVTYVNGAKEIARVTVNDRTVRTMKASLGKASTPTYNGIKVVMQKGEDTPGTDSLRPNGAVLMSDTGHNYTKLVDWSVRVTESGEYLHAAPWNGELGEISTSDGCTNLSDADGEWYYKFSKIGDLVIHSATGGGQLPLWDGYTDWNIDWATYKRGGLLSPV